MDKKEEYIASTILEDGVLAEMIYRPDTGETRLITCKDGQFTTHEKIGLDDRILAPYPPDSQLIRKGVVLFPSEVEEYNSEKDLINEIRLFIHKYLDVSEIFETICVYYILLTYLYDKLSNILYVRFIGDCGTGKSRALAAIGRLCYRPMDITGAVSVSAIFRIIDKFKGTLVLDEADFSNSDTYNEVIKILNSGYERGKCVLRSEENKNKWDVVPFDCYGPKVIATRFNFKDLALESRCLTEIMSGAKLREDIPLNLPDSFEVEARKLRNKLLCFRFKNYNEKLDCNIELDKNIEPRLRQIAMIMLSIIKDEKAREDIKNFIVEYNKQIVSDRALGYETKLVEAIYALREENPITIKGLTEKYNEIRDDEKDLTNSSIGRILKRRLHITTEHSREGRYIKVNNKEMLEVLFKKYGFDVKDVNLVKDNKGEGDRGQVTINDIPF